jgi:Flavodoxin-like fold
LSWWKSITPARISTSRLTTSTQIGHRGARSAGHDVEHVFRDEYVQRMLGNCRRCRRIEDGSCSLDDRYEELLIDRMLPADGIIFAMPLHFYGMPGPLSCARDLGALLFDIRVTDYRLDTVRSGPTGCGTARWPDLADFCTRL